MFAEQNPEEEQPAERGVSVDRVAHEARLLYEEYERGLASGLSNFSHVGAIAESTEGQNLFLTVCAYSEVASEMAGMLARETLFSSMYNPFGVRDRWRLLSRISDSREVDSAVGKEVSEIADWLVREKLGESPESVWVRKYLCEGLHECFKARPGSIGAVSEGLSSIQQILESAVDEDVLSLDIPAHSTVLFCARQVTESLHRAFPEEFPVDWLVDKCLLSEVNDKAAFTAVDLGLKYSPEKLDLRALGKFELGLKRRLETLNPARLHIEGAGLSRNLRNYSRLADLLGVAPDERQEVASQLADLAGVDSVNQAVWKIIGHTDIWVDDRNQPEDSTTVIVLTEGSIRDIPETTFSPFGPEDRELALEHLNRHYGEVVDEMRGSPDRDSDQHPLVAALELCGDESIRALGEPERGEIVAKRWGEILANEVPYGCDSELGLIYSRLPYLSQEYPAEINQMRAGLVSALKSGMEQGGKGSRSIMRMIDVPVFSTDEKIDLCRSALKVLQNGYVPTDLFGEPDVEQGRELKSEVMLQLARCLPLDPGGLTGLESFLETRREQYQNALRDFPEYLQHRSR